MGQQQQQKNTIKTLRQTAKDCLKDGRQLDAFLHLSHAIQLDKNNCELLSERSVCARDNIQYHFAIEDAQEIIQLRPESWLGHVRLAEVYHATYNYDLAIPAFQTAFQCLDADKSYCKQMIDACKRESALDKRANMQIPWVGCALGMIVSSLLVVLDYLSFGHNSYIAHPLLKILSCAIASLIGYGGGRLYRFYLEKTRKQMLDPPLDLLDLNFKPHSD